VKVLRAPSPDKVPYDEIGLENAILLDSTGKWRDKEGLSLHLKSPGIKKVVVTAPAKEVPNIVFGVNQSQIVPEKQIFSAASCTTNAVTPLLFALDNQYGIKHCHIETIHSYTNDQNLMDNIHAKSRRGRAAALNIVITETGSSKAVAAAVPALQGKLTANAVRVPTPNASLAILNADLNTEAVTKSDLNDFLQMLSLDSALQDQIAYSTSQSIVSSDVVGVRQAALVDASSTICVGSKAIIYAWYDNEWGYANQVIRVAQRIAGLELTEYPIRKPKRRLSTASFV